MQIAILGAGMVGSAMAIDLAKKYSVTSFDANGHALDRVIQKDPGIKTIRTDLGDHQNYSTLLSGFDFVVSAVPGFMGFKTLEAVIQAKKSVADISFFPEDALELDELARQNQVTAIVDCGVAPGLSNLLLGHLNRKMKINSFECLVGGLPKKRTKPFEYKAPFSPIDVLEEYMRPARYAENGYLVTKPALSDSEYVDFESTGTLEAFNTDGLRTLLTTMKHIPDMKEKTLRYPGHIDLMKALFAAGFFDQKPIAVNGHPVSPLEFSSSLLFDKWNLGPGEEEFTIMRVTVRGDQKSICYELYDEYDEMTRTSSMARTTGYSCTAMLNLMTSGLFCSKGVFPPELIGGEENCFHFVMDHLQERDIRFRITES